MKFEFLLASFTIAISMNACEAHDADNPGVGPDATDMGGDAGPADDGEAGPSNGDSQAGAPNSDGNAGAANEEGAGSVGGSRGGAAGSASNSTAGSTSGGSGGTASGGAGKSGSPHSDDQGESGSGNADPDAPATSGGSGGLTGSAGSRGDSLSGGSGGVSAAGGVSAGGVSASGGVSGLAGTAGTAEIAGSGGSGDAPGSGGSAGLAGTGGSDDGVSGSGGSAGLAGNGGSGGSAGDDDGSVSLDPEFLFTQEEFGGNGRTCVTCHAAGAGTINPAQIQSLYAADPDDPIFRRIDSDDGASDDYTQLRARATFRVTVDLPPGVFLTSDPSATSIVLRRGVPSTINTPALDPVLMWDGRVPDLKEQALGAILGHSEATVTPTAAQLDLIIGFEKGPDFFSSDILRAYSAGGPAPTWPEGVTAEEQRGRRWFAPSQAAPRFNICGQCHGGPMTNETQTNSGLPVGKHFQTANVSEFNTLGNPTYEFTFPDPRNPGRTVKVVSPDPGRALVTGDARDVNFFKIPTLWGVKNTAPYFHDNSAQTLEELMDHYEKHLATFLFRNFNYPTPHVPTAQDKADIIAYLKLL